MCYLSGELTVLLITLVVAKVRERLAVSKQEVQKFDLERFYLRKPSELEIGKQYQIEISNRSAALENLNDSEGIKRALKNIKENMKTSATESKFVRIEAT
jgi:hypothetical protein